MLNDFKCDECGRQMALDRLDVLDSAQEQPFEKIINLVQKTLRVPMCAISLIDQDRQWFKARRGLDVAETPRDISFCTHAIEKTEPFIVRDAQEDETFKDNPLVTGAPHIRSYAGIPLKTPDGYNIGTLCAIDTEPRAFPPHEIDILESFSKVVLDQLELRQIAATDALTGALSRRAWFNEAKLEVERADRYGRPLSMAIIDIDHFKEVNDVYGHPAGDTVIQGLAEVASGEIREHDAFGRFGGEEFVLLFPETNVTAAFEVAERVRMAFEAERFSCLAGGGWRTSEAVGRTPKEAWGGRAV